MTALELADQHVGFLGLKQTVDVWGESMDDNAFEQLSYPEMREQLLLGKVEARRRSLISTTPRMASFPFQRFPVQCDFACQTSVYERQIEGLAGLFPNRHSGRVKPIAVTRTGCMRDPQFWVPLGPIWAFGPELFRPTAGITDIDRYPRLNRFQTALI